nr:MAG TPA_asm: hypothetical protein [Caudoviricetes sp.]
MGPLIGLYDNTSTSLVGTYDWGTIKAQTPTPVLTIQVWNNKNGQEDVSDLKEPQIEVLDSNGLTADSDVPKDKWVQVNIPSVDGNDSTWTPIGGADVKQIRANNNVSAELIIKGTKNDGDPISYPQNVATVNVRLQAPINSTPGDKTFKIRLTGYYT